MEAEKLSQAITPQETLGQVIKLPVAVGALAIENAAQNTDHQETTVSKESIAQQLNSAYKGYQAIVGDLNIERVEIAPADTLKSELEVWLTEDKLAYVAATQEADPELRFTLVATPNVLASAESIISAAKIFGQTQPYSTNMFEELFGKYSAKQLSGTNPDNENTIQFSLMPSKPSPEMYGNVTQQRAMLAKLQAADKPHLKVPSVLEAITYWQTLRAGGQKLADSTALGQTYIRHFDLPEQRLNDWSFVPYTYVRAYGWPDLNGSRIHKRDHCRISLG